MKYILLLLLPFIFSCSKKAVSQNKPIVVLKPKIVTEPTAHDTDDPAIWINPADPSKSLVIGTDKNKDGALYIFDLDGKILNKSIPLARPNNVDIAYGIDCGGKKIDFAVVTERNLNKIRIFSLPDLLPIDNGGIEVFEGETQRDPMGVALYTAPDGKGFYAIVGRKTGPSGSYLWQYKLEGNKNGTISAKLVRKFGNYSGKAEIESIAVDNELGFIYYSDEMFGIRKYYADPSKNDNAELTVFGKTGFKSDHEGISIVKKTATTGYILVSNQQANTFMVYNRENISNPNVHLLYSEIPMSTIESDGSDATTAKLNKNFPNGMFVAMSEGRVFHYYDIRDIEAMINANVK